MKIQIDTDKKTVRVLDNVKLGELILVIKSMLGDEYEEFLLIQEELSYSIPWINPIIIPYYPTTIPYYPVTWPTITCDTGTYNVEIKSIN